MGYYIHYGEKMDKTQVPEKRQVSGAGKALWGATAILLAIYMAIFLTSGDNRLIPGDDGKTTAAASQFLSDLREGVSVQDAFLVFCREIIKDEIS